MLHSASVAPGPSLRAGRTYSARPWACPLPRTCPAPRAQRRAARAKPAALRGPRLGRRGPAGVVLTARHVPQSETMHAGKAMCRWTRARMWLGSTCCHDLSVLLCPVCSACYCVLGCICYCTCLYACLSLSCAISCACAADLQLLPVMKIPNRAFLRKTFAGPV